MIETQEILLSTWLGVPIAIWIAGLILSVLLVLRVKRLRFNFKYRNRELTIETDNRTSMLERRGGGGALRSSEKNCRIGSSDKNRNYC